MSVVTSVSMLLCVCIHADGKTVKIPTLESVGFDLNPCPAMRKLYDLGRLA